MKIKILVAEDETLAFDVIQYYLSLEEFCVLWVKTGVAALNACENDAAIALVLMDGGMPLMNGFEAAKQIKTKFPLLPIICISANEIPGGYQSYFVAHHHKPIDFDLLIACIRATIHHD